MAALSNVGVASEGFRWRHYLSLKNFHFVESRPKFTKMHTHLWHVHVLFCRYKLGWLLLNAGWANCENVALVEILVQFLDEKNVAPFSATTTEQGMGHSELPITEVTHWALDPWPMWPMTHGSPGPSPHTSASLTQMNTYLQDGTIFCNHSGILNQLMIDKFAADIKRTKTSICIIVGLLQYWIDYWIVKQWRSTRVKTNEMPFLNFLLVLFLTLSFTVNFL